jgi:hypothetical protein
MNAISKALTELRFRIPDEILRVVFTSTQDWRAASISIDEIILRKVIRPRVLVDANLVGGQTIIVDLSRINPEFYDNTSIIYHIPSEYLLGRSLISALSVGYLPVSPRSNHGYGGFAGVASPMGSVNASNITHAAMRVGDSFSAMPNVSTAQVEVIGDNTILIRDMNRVTSCYQLRCIVGNDPNMDNISPRSYHSFCKLCELAVKSYIYNTMIIKMDTSYLQGGQELGAFKSYVENLADSEEMYQTELRESWMKISFMNNSMDHASFIRSMVSPGI